MEFKDAGAHIPQFGPNKNAICAAHVKVCPTPAKYDYSSACFGSKKTIRNGWCVSQLQEGRLREKQNARLRPFPAGPKLDEPLQPAAWPCLSESSRACPAPSSSSHLGRKGGRTCRLDLCCSLCCTEMRKVCTLLCNGPQSPSWATQAIPGRAHWEAVL